MTTTVLTFGHIPKFHGGRQQSGLANAIWAIASNMTDRDSHFDVVFCATDIRSRSTCIDGLPVVGWTKASLLAAILGAPVRSIGLVVQLTRPCIKYGLPLVRTALRGLHLQQAIAHATPDYLHLHTCEAVAFLEAAIFDPSKTLVTIHGVHGDTGPHNLRAMEAALNRAPLRFLAFVSSENMTEWRELYGPSTTERVTVPNAFDRTEFYLAGGVSMPKGGVKDTYRLVTVGSINENKGQRRIIEAMTRLNAMGASHQIDYTMIGNGDPEAVDDLLRRAANAGIQVRHLPYLSPPDLRAHLSHADFMILASEKEGFGLVFLESIACGTPVVLPKDLPICQEPKLISDTNAVLLDSSSTEAVFAFLANLPTHRFVDVEVAGSLPETSWRDAGARYRTLLSSRYQTLQNPGR